MVPRPMLPLRFGCCRHPALPLQAERRLLEAGSFWTRQSAVGTVDATSSVQVRIKRHRDYAGAPELRLAGRSASASGQLRSFQIAARFTITSTAFSMSCTDTHSSRE